MIYKGWLAEDGYGCLQVRANKDKDNYKTDYYLVEAVDNDFKKGDMVSVSYFLATQEITEEQATEALVKRLSGSIDAKFLLDAYSEWTILDYEEKLVVGGHDLFAELEDAEGKYLLLKIEKSDVV